MKLPKNLASRYTQMTPKEMESGGQDKPIEDTEITRAILRPGVIQWDDTRDAGVWFNIRKDGGKQVSSTSHLNLDKILQSRYVEQDVQQGKDVREFPTKKAPTAVQKEEAKIVAKVKAVAEAAKVEAKAKALASKAKATKEEAVKEAALAGYFGDEAAVQAAMTRFVEAQQAAFAPTCTSADGTRGLPASLCDPKLMERFVKAQEALAATQAGAGGAGAAGGAPSGKKKIIIAAVVVALGVGIYLWKTKG